jgi:CheY-like chemotaxis protein/DNA-binding CsgD family transcriptional regulator
MNTPPLLDRSTSDVVLIVDDQPDNLSLLHDALDESGYTVLVATHGEAALQRAAQAAPDIVLLDAVMPGIDGFEVARRLKADPKTAVIPIVFMTGLTDTEHVLAAFAAGGVDYVTKPIRPREVLARLAAHVHNARQARQARNALDAFGHATLVVRAGDGRLVWQTALARQMLHAWFGGDSPWTPTPLLDWVREQVAQGRAGQEAQTGSLVQGARRLHFTLHESTGDDEWLIVLREANDAAMLEAMMLAFKLTAREAEVLYWVVKGKTNRDVSDILGASPGTIKKHLERVYEKLGVETRTAAATLAMGRVSALGVRG